MICCECKNKKINILGTTCSFCGHSYCKSCKGLEKVLYFIQKYKLMKRKKDIELKDYIRYGRLSESDLHVEYFEEIHKDENKNNIENEKCFSLCNIL